MGKIRVPALIAALAATALGGCGSGSTPAPTRTHASATAGRTTPAPLPRKTITIPTPGPTGVPPGASAVRVIRGWSDALRHGDVQQAASFFALPSEMVNGIDANGQVSVIRIHTTLQARLANATLPCGARLVSADQRGRYVNALFRLTGRTGPGGASCIPGTGQTARTNFVIRGGRIVEWIRAPNDPGDNGTPRRRGHRAPAPVNPTPQLGPPPVA